MFRLLRAAPRALSLSTSSSVSPVSARPRSIATFSPSLLRQPTFVSAPTLRRRFVSQDARQSESGSETVAAEVSPAAESATEDAAEAAVVEAAEAAAETAAENAPSTATGADTMSTSGYTPGQTTDQAGSAATGAAATFNPRKIRNSSAGVGRTSPQLPMGPPSEQLYVGNLFFDVTDEDLKREFSRFGVVQKTHVVFDPRGLSRGFGYVTMDSVENAAAAIEGMNMQLYEGRRITVQYPRPSIQQHSRDSHRGRNFRPVREEAPPSRTLFIGNMSFEMNDKDLNDLFSGVSNVIDVRVAIDRRTGQPRGFAHADFIDVASATKAKSILATREIFGRRLRIDYSANNGSQGRKAAEAPADES